MIEPTTIQRPKRHPHRRFLDSEKGLFGCLLWLIKIIMKDLIGMRASPGGHMLCSPKPLFGRGMSQGKKNIIIASLLPLATGLAATGPAMVRPRRIASIRVPEWPAIASHQALYLSQIMRLPKAA